MNAGVVVLVLAAVALLTAALNPPRFDPLRPGWRAPRQKLPGSRHAPGTRFMEARVVAGVATLIALAEAAAAQEPRLQAEVFGKLDSGFDESGWGLLLGRGRDSGHRFELLLETWREDTFVWQYHEGPILGTYRYGGADLFSLQLGLGRYWAGPTFYPFFTVSAGFTVAQPDFGPVSTKSYATASIGGGFEVMLSEVWAFRLDGRAEWIDWQPDRSGWDCGWMDGRPCVRQGGDFGFGGVTHDSLRPVLRLGIGARW